MATVTKPMNLDETQQQIVAKLDAIKTAIENGGSGGGSAKIFLGTLDEIEAAIAAGTIETNEAIKCKDDYEDIVGNMAQIAELGDGRICGAINSLNQNITNIGTHEHLASNSGSSAQYTVKNLNNYKMLALYMVRGDSAFENGSMLPILLYKNTSATKRFTVSSYYGGTSAEGGSYYINDTTIQLIGNVTLFGIK